jgi:hypothetical protein
MHEAVPPIQSHDCPAGLVDLIMRCLSKRPEGRPSSMDEVILLLKQATGLSLTMSGSFALSQELRLSGSPVLTQSGRMPTATPSHAFATGAHAIPMPMGTLSGDVMNPMLQTGMHPYPVMPAPLVSQPPPPSTSWLPRIVAVSALLIAAGFLALRFVEQKPNANGTPDSNGLGTLILSGADTPGANPTSQASTPKPAVPQNHVIVTVTSNPPGASVSVDGKTYGETPADIEWWGDQAAPGREVNFVLTKDGFEKVTVVRSVVGERLTVDAQLARNPPPVLRPKSRERPAEPKGPVVVPDNFKDDPY